MFPLEKLLDFRRRTCALVTHSRHAQTFLTGFIGHNLRHFNIICSIHYLEALSNCSSVLPC